MLAVKLIPAPIIVGILSIVIGLWYKGLDRKLAARMQSRVGPPLRQPFIDIKKLLLKETVVPDQAVGWLFNIAPVFGLGGTVTLLLYLPLGDLAPVLSGFGDLILVLYLLTVPALAMVLGGFASSSPYAIVGAQREMVMMISYELPLATTVVTIAWKLNNLAARTAEIAQPIQAFSFQAISNYPLWGYLDPIGLLGFSILLLVMLIVTPIELSKIPFDIPEAETEIAEGLMTEYSGRNLALFYLTDAIKTVALATLIIAIFFPYSLGSILGLTGALGSFVTVLFFMIKLFVVILFSVTIIRVAAARFKVDQVVYTFWVPIFLASLLGLGLVYLDSFM